MSQCNGMQNMEHVDLQTETTIKLYGLSAEEKKFYRHALKKFQENMEWLAFDEFAFGMDSPIYRGLNSHLDVWKNPLFLALQNMSLQLGVQQGMISRKPIKKRSSVA